MKILHLAASHRWTGVAEPAARLARAETQAGHDVLFAMTGGASFESNTRDLGVKVTSAVPFDRNWWPTTKLKNLRALKKQIVDFAPDIVHSHLTHDHVLASIVVRGMNEKLKLVRTFHRETAPRSDIFTRRMVMKHTAGALAVSSHLAQQIRDAFDWEAERLLVVGGVYDEHRFTPGSGERMRDQWGISENDVVLGIVSRIRIARGFRWLLDAAESALPTRPNVKLVICGRGNWQEEMEAEISSHPAREQIVYAGYQTGADLEDSYRAFDAALLLRPGNDGACRGAIEAMATGLPVIGGSIGALKDLIGEGDQRGWLVGLDDVGALSAAMIEAATNHDARRERGDAALEFVTTRHTESVQAARVLEFYETLLNK